MFKAPSVKFKAPLDKSKAPSVQHDEGFRHLNLGVVTRTWADTSTSRECATMRVRVEESVRRTKCEQRQCADVLKKTTRCELYTLKSRPNRNGSGGTSKRKMWWRTGVRSEDGTDHGRGHGEDERTRGRHFLLEVVTRTRTDHGYTFPLSIQGLIDLS